MRFVQAASRSCPGATSIRGKRARGASESVDDPMVMILDVRGIKRPKKSDDIAKLVVQVGVHNEQMIR